jgi:hypothetical protein
MTEMDEDLLRRLVREHKADGRCVYDPQAVARGCAGVPGSG